MSQRRTGSKFGNKHSSRSSSSSSSSASMARNANFDKDYRESTPFSTTTADTSSDDDSGIAHDTTPATPTTPTTPTPIVFKPKKQISPVFTSPHFPPPPSVVVSQLSPQPQIKSQPQTQLQPQPQPSEISELPELPELPVSDNIDDEFNHFRRVKKRIFWTHLELEALENGMKEFGTQWARILRMYGGNHGPLRNRSAVQLKDKARNEKLRRIKSKQDLGVFCMATGGDDITEDELVDDS
jgi:hypothetical protein